MPRGRKRKRATPAMATAVCPPAPPLPLPLFYVFAAAADALMRARHTLFIRYDARKIAYIVFMAGKDSGALLLPRCARMRVSIALF